MEIIYCAGGNSIFADVAITAGFRYGSRLPETVYGDLYFADQDWRTPNRPAYMASLAMYRPNLATVLDFESIDQLDEVLSWSEDAARFVDEVIIIPKISGGIEKLPKRIGGKPVRLGYSVPTKHGGTSVPVWEFAGWPVHLLGGSPQAQRKLRHYFDTRSADGNMAQKMATQFCAFFDPRRSTRRGYWPTLADYDGAKWRNGEPDADAHVEAFRRSCVNIMAMWRQ